MTHYYTDNKDLSSDRREFDYHFDDEVFHFTTDNGVFSKGNVDYGSYVLIKNIYRRNLGKSLLDLGCGYGPIGIIIKRFNPDIEVKMVDVNSRATELAQFNCRRNETEIEVHLCDDITALGFHYDTVVFNPPIRAGKSVIYDLYEKVKMVLNDDGHLYIVVRKKQGALSHVKELETLFESVEVIAKDGGYLVIDCSNVL